jgi:hypothetical protein
VPFRQPAAKPDQVEAVAHSQSDIRYAEGLECHLDEGGTVSASNVRDLIAMVRWNAEQAIAAMQPMVTDETVEAEVARLMEALVQHNDRLRSAQAIASRDGADTNWLSFRGQCTFTLAEYHELVNECRQALKGPTDAD